MNKKTLLTKLFLSAAAAAAVFLSSACTGLLHKGGEMLEGNPRETRLAVYRSGEEEPIELKEIVLEDGTWIVEISNSSRPGLSLRGTMPDGRGEFDFYEARVLSSHVNGWNEFVLDVSGKGVFSNPKALGGDLFIKDEIVRVQISAGKIRLKDSRLTGNAALTPLRGRRERILALAEWMEARHESEGKAPALSTEEEFDAYWKPVLFPELVSGRERPASYSTENAVRHRADSVKWNLTYTQSLFPGELWEYRNSGALLRDWEEALPWIFLESSWNNVIGSFNNTTLRKIAR